MRNTHNAAREQQEAQFRQRLEALRQEPEHCARSHVLLKLDPGKRTHAANLDDRAPAGWIDIPSKPSAKESEQATVNAGCEIQPSWGNGFWSFVQMTQDLYNESGLSLSAVHVLILPRDETAIRHALRSVPKEKRPQLRTVPVFRYRSLSLCVLRSAVTSGVYTQGTCSLWYAPFADLYGAPLQTRTLESKTSDGRSGGRWCPTAAASCTIMMPLST